MKKLIKVGLSIVLILIMVLPVMGSSETFDYDGALKNSILFYDANKCGPDAGEDNFFRYRPHKKLFFRIDKDDHPLDYLRVFAAALTCQTPLQISWNLSSKKNSPRANWQSMLPIFNITDEDEEQFIKRIGMGTVKRIRILSLPSDALIHQCGATSCFLDKAPVLANGRIELLHYLREISLSKAYHRYGDLGVRENELRKPIETPFREE